MAEVARPNLPWGVVAVVFAFFILLRVFEGNGADRIFAERADSIQSVIEDSMNVVIDSAKAVADSSANVARTAEADLFEFRVASNARVSRAESAAEESHALADSVAGELVAHLSEDELDLFAEFREEKAEEIAAKDLIIADHVAKDVVQDSAISSLSAALFDSEALVGELEARDLMRVEVNANLREAYDRTRGQNRWLKLGGTVLLINGISCQTTGVGLCPS